MLNIPAKNFQKLTDSIEVLRLVNESQEYVVDLFSYKSPQSQKFSVYAMQHRLQKVPLPGILRVEKFQQLSNRQKLLVNSTTLSAESKTHLQNELLIDHTLADGRLEILRLQEPQEHLIHQLQVWPGSLQSRIILLGIEIGILTGRQRAK